MTQVYEFDGIRPVVAPSAFVHDTAVLIGDVIIGPNCYVGPGACLRGDFGRIVFETGSNIQDTCVVHSFPDKDVIVEEDGHIGHGAVLHGCIVKRNAMVGMNAVVMDDAVVGENAIVAAMAFVKAGFVIPAGSLVAGMPARVVRTLTADEIAWKSGGTALYQRLAQRSAETMRRVEPLSEPEPDRARPYWPAVAPTLQESRKK